MHGAGAGERDPDAVEDVSVGEDPDVEIGLEDVVEATNLLIPEKRVGHPHLGGVCHRQVSNLIWKNEHFPVL